MLLIQGFVDIKYRQGKLAKKRWRKQWVSVLVCKEPDRCGLNLVISDTPQSKPSSIFVESVDRIKRTHSRSHLYAFELGQSGGDGVSLSGGSESESQRWMALIRSALLQASVPGYILSPQTDTDLDADLYEVAVIDNKASESLGITSYYSLQVTAQGLTLQDVDNHMTICFWPLTEIQKFTIPNATNEHDHNRVFAIHVGRSFSDTQTFFLFVKDATQVLEQVKKTIVQLLGGIVSEQTPSKSDTRNNNYDKQSCCAVASSLKNGQLLARNNKITDEDSEHVDHLYYNNSSPEANYVDFDSDNLGKMSDVGTKASTTETTSKITKEISSSQTEPSGTQRLFRQNATKKRSSRRQASSWYAGNPRERLHTWHSTSNTIDKEKPCSKACRCKYQSHESYITEVSQEPAIFNGSEYQLHKVCCNKLMDINHQEVEIKHKKYLSMPDISIGKDSDNESANLVKSKTAQTASESMPVDYIEPDEITVIKGCSQNASQIYSLTLPRRRVSTVSHIYFDLDSSSKTESEQYKKNLKTFLGIPADLSDPLSEPPSLPARPRSLTRPIKSHGSRPSLRQTVLETVAKKLHKRQSDMNYDSSSEDSVSDSESQFSNIANGVPNNGIVSVSLWPIGQSSGNGVQLENDLYSQNSLNQSSEITDGYEDHIYSDVPEYDEASNSDAFSTLVFNELGIFDLPENVCQQMTAESDSPVYMNVPCNKTMPVPAHASVFNCSESPTSVTSFSPRRSFVKSGCYMSMGEVTDTPGNKHDYSCQSSEVNNNGVDMTDTEALYTPMTNTLIHQGTIIYENITETDKH